MHIINAEDVHTALPLGVALLERAGRLAGSRNGPVKMLDEPVTTVFRNPQRRVVLWPERDANPFFHYLESLWMLAGMKELAPMAKLLPNMASYSDDGETLNGAYGNRWRYHFHRDQLKLIVEELKRDFDSRRCVLQMWDAKNDLGMPSKDLPCNTQVYFRIVQNRLNMTVCNRSNDIVWGLYGANAVHFSVLHEYMAARIGVDLGVYWHVSNNLHGYIGTEPYRRAAELSVSFEDFYMFGGYRSPYEEEVVPYSLFVGEGIASPDVYDDAEDARFLWEVRVLMQCIADNGMPYLSDFIFEPVRTGASLWQTLKTWRHMRDYDAAAHYLPALNSKADWLVAATQWLQRRKGADDVRPETTAAEDEG